MQHSSAFTMMVKVFLFAEIVCSEIVFWLQSFLYNAHKYIYVMWGEEFLSIQSDGECENSPIITL